MKKLFLLLTALAIVEADAQRQTTFGVKGGLNIANLFLKGEGDLTHSSRMSFNAGGFAHFHIKGNVALQPELLFSGQGTKMQADHGNDVFPRYENYNWVFDYINAPVMLQYLLSKTISVETGPQIGTLLSANIKSSHEVPFDLRDQLKRFDFSWNFGGSYISKLGLGIGFRYTIGLNNINKSFDYIYKNRVWLFDVLYAIKK